MVSIDGTDCAVEARGKCWYSHKFKRSGVRYEVAVSIKCGDIVWIKGPLPCGEWPDIKMFRDALIHYLDENERVEADGGYIGEAPSHVKTPNMFTRNEEKLAMQQHIRNRHETVNKRFKQWGCIRQRFRHTTENHSACFRAVAVLTQLCIEFGEPLFSVAEYSDIVTVQGNIVVEQDHNDDSSGSL